MFWFLVLFGVVLSSLMMYSGFRHKFKQIKGLFIVQFYYLVISIPLGALCLINIGMDISKRPEHLNLPLSETFVFSFYFLTIIMGAIAAGIHAITSCIYDVTRDQNTEVFDLNEYFHGPFSHNILYISTMFCVFFLALLEINHPSIRSRLNHDFFMVLGVLLALMAGIGIVWSTYLKVNLLATALIFLALEIIIMQFNLNLNVYPIATTSVYFLATIVIVLTFYMTAFAISERMKAKLIKHTFPKKHPYKRTDEHLTIHTSETK